MEGDASRHLVRWNIAFWLLLSAWVLGAGLNMAHVHGGFLTNYLADLAFPPWFYIYIRGLWKNSPELPKLVFFGDWFGKTPERASLSIFAVGVIIELKTLYWPGGPLAGTFDPMDIMSYGAGLVLCYLFDKRRLKAS
jgi:hypothetical protein